MNADERAIVEAIDQQGLLAALSELVAIPSLGGTPEEYAAQEAVAALMKRCGLEVEQWNLDLPTLYAHPACSWELPRERGLGVVGSLGSPGAGRDLIFNGHVDVVPAGDLANWTYPPWQTTLTNGRIYGRGTTDMKGGLCCAIFAAKALRDAGVALHGRLVIQSVIGEEDGGLGTLGAILHGPQADGAIVIEPTELKIAPLQAGAHNFRLTVYGQAAHGCVREEGVSAIEKFFPLHQAILHLERERNQRFRHPLYARYNTPYPICIGTVHAGTWASSEAESLVAEGRYGIAIGEDPLVARHELEAAIGTAVAADPWLREHPPLLEWWGGTFDPAATPQDHPLVQTVAASYTDATGNPLRFEGMTYGADMRLLANTAGIPTVLFGPGDVRIAHRPDEYVTPDDLLRCTRTLALTALRFIGSA
ncbi:ArgE/DapE family deacylase [Candidatus Chloroploca sp. M-50]|uniref:ArgE/DapE family deacylase n=1 Tax=Candidatus Chloroploca mongolica TaxID=2528176 RepID=A0ABS4DC67_9CHLR|nr:ArgE/DapE family deacylase [Candidatus Chloroploca mongolica]MBP1467031.1 ArgE/DapE family deacylase [Candidatus Chloroploca mongolica]